MEISMNDMKDIKKILTEYEAPYNHNDWIKLEKDLPKPSGISGSAKTILVAVALIVAVGSIIVLTKSFTNNDKFAKQSKSAVLVNERSLDLNIRDIDVDKINNNVLPRVDNIKLADTKSYEKAPINIKSSNTETPSSPGNKTLANTINNEGTPETKEPTINNNIVTNTEIPSADNTIFSIEVIENCIPAKIVLRALNVPKGCEVIWDTDEMMRVYGQNTEHTYLSAGEYEPEVMIVYNNFVVKTEKLRKITINEQTKLKINFENTDNLFYFTCNNKEELRLLWSIDNQQFRDKEIKYEFTRGGEYLVNLVAVNEYGCKSDISEKVNIVIEHVFFVPNAFIPNSNGVNSYFGPIGEDMDFVSYKLIIIDSNGNSVFESDSPKFMWNGKINNIGAEARPGFYLWEIKTLDNYGNIQTKKGRVNLIWN